MSKTFSISLLTGLLLSGVFLLPGAFSSESGDENFFPPGPPPPPSPGHELPPRAEKEKDPPPPPPLHHGAKQRKGFLNSLSKEEREKFRQLASENPEAFKKEMIKRIHEARKKELAELMKLRSEYLNAKDEDAKEAARKKIEAALRQKFEQHQEMTRRRIEETERKLLAAQEKLLQFKKEYEKRKLEADQIIAKGVADFTNPAQEPRLGPPPPRRKGKVSPQAEVKP